MNPKVSILLTTHGKAKFLKQALGSVLAQTFEDWELIIACDGVLEVEPQPYGWGMSDHRMRQIVFNVPEGVVCRFAYTINEAFKLSRGEYITYLCHDDLYLPWRLEVMTHYLKCGDDVSVCFGYQRLMEEFRKSDKPNEILETYLQPGIREGNPDHPAGTVDHSSVMHRRECFEKAGGWNEAAPMRYGDAFFWLRLQEAGYKFHCIPEVLDVHRFNQDSVTWKIDHPE